MLSAIQVDQHAQLPPAGDTARFARGPVPLVPVGSIVGAATSRPVRMAVAWLIAAAVVALWVAFELGAIATGEPPFIMRLSLGALLYAAFNGLSINADDDANVWRLGLAAAVFAGSLGLWIAFELGWVGQGEPPLVARISLAALVYEGFNGISVNKQD